WHRHTAEFLQHADLVPAAVHQRAHRLLERVGQGHGVCVGVEHRWVAIRVGERFRDRALGQPGDLAEHLGGGVGIEVGVCALTEHLVQAVHLEQVEYLVTNVALVVAHVSSSSRTPLAVGYLGKLPTSNWRRLYRSVTSTQSLREQFPLPKQLSGWSGRRIHS